MQYEVIPRPREKPEPLGEGEAMRRAVISAMTGQGALVLREDGALLWEMAVVRTVDDDHPCSVMVHFRGEIREVDVAMATGVPF